MGDPIDISLYARDELVPRRTTGDVVLFSTAALERAQARARESRDPPCFYFRSSLPGLDCRFFPGQHELSFRPPSEEEVARYRFLCERRGW